MKEIEISKKNSIPFIVSIDDKFFDEISKITWYITKVSDQLAYAFCRTKEGNTIYMHRKIMEMQLGRKLERIEEVDHIDNNGLNNQLENLRIVSRSENQANQRGHRDSKSKYIGVHFNTRYTNPYRVKLMKNGINIHVNKGFDSAEEAAEIRDLLSIKYFGEYAKLNFPDKRNEYLQRIRDGFNPDEYTKTFTSKYRGVSKYGDGNYHASTAKNNKDIYIGIFKTEQEAAEHYDMVAIQLNGINTYLNFPEKKEYYLQKLKSGYNPIKAKRINKKDVTNINTLDKYY